MNKTIIRIIFLMTCISIVGCTKDNTQEGDGNTEVEYYVKYASDGLNWNSIYPYTATYTDATGKTIKLENQMSDSFKRTVGPVSKGFEAKFGVSSANGNDNRPRTVRIEVKKGDAPFVVKAENSSPRLGVGVEYTIDF